MSYDKKKLDTIYKKTDGRCHLCHKKVVRKNHGILKSRGAWEVDHSVPKVKDGTDKLQNLYPACTSCNRKKGTSSTQVARNKNNVKTAPLSREKKTENAMIGGGVGLIVGCLVPFGLIGIISGTVIGAAIGSNHKSK